MQAELNVHWVSVLERPRETLTPVWEGEVDHEVLVHARLTVHVGYHRHFDWL